MEEDDGQKHIQIAHPRWRKRLGVRTRMIPNTQNTMSSITILSDTPRLGIVCHLNNQPVQW